jgi:hypothetical protein
MPQVNNDPADCARAAWSSPGRARETFVAPRAPAAPPEPDCPPGGQPAAPSPRPAIPGGRRSDAGTVRLTGRDIAGLLGRGQARCAGLRQSASTVHDARNDPAADMHTLRAGLLICPQGERPPCGLGGLAVRLLEALAHGH